MENTIRKYEVVLFYGAESFIVEATNKEEAEEMAVEMAGKSQEICGAETELLEEVKQ